MKKLLSILSLFILAVTLFANIFVSDAYAYPALDHIHYYEIKVDPNKEDGSLNMNYKLKWEVLDSSSEGPLEWVKIGIPNRFVSNLTAKTDNIKNIEYYSEDGSYIRVDFKKSYYRGEIVDFEFSFSLERMYHLFDDIAVYNFKNGYFDNIRVDECVILWNKDGVEEYNSSSIVTEENGYIKYKSALSYGDVIDVSVKYNQAYFTTLDEKKQYSDAWMTVGDIIMVFVVITLVASAIILIIYGAYKAQDPYMVNRGFCGRPHYFYYGFYHHHHYYNHGVDRKGSRIVNPVSSTGGSSGGFSGGGGHCACACACACAGGGRAGCSKKDFYSAKLNPNKSIELLDKE